jgi:hypothetical protein
MAKRIIDGYLYVKNFEKDVKNAPREMLRFTSELPTLETAVWLFQNLVMDSWRNDYITSLEDYLPAL